MLRLRVLLAFSAAPGLGVIGGFACLASLCSGAQAGAFMQPRGHGQVIVTGRFERSDTYLGRNGRLQPVRDYRKFELQAWAEYGLTDQLTLIAAPTVLRVTTSVPANPLRRETGLRDTYGRMEVGARLKLWTIAGGILSVQATGAFSQKIGGANSAGITYDRNALDLRLLYGRNFQLGTKRGFVDVQSGYRVRAGAPDEWHTDLTIGLQLYPRWTTLLQSFNLVTMPYRLAPRRRIHKLQTSVVYRFTKRWAVQAGTFSTFAARNARRDHGYIAALWHHF
jgi:protein XagA